MSLRSRRCAGARWVGGVLALLSVACSGNTTTTSPSTASTGSTSTSTAQTITETFSGTLPVGGARFYSFSLSTSGTVTATLVSIGNAAVPATVMVSLGIGSPSGTVCSVATPTTVQLGGTVVTSASESPGTYCVNIADLGNLFAPSAFTVTIDHP